MQGKETRNPAGEDANYEIYPMVVARGAELEETLDSRNGLEELKKAKIEIAPLSIELGPNVSIKVEDNSELELNDMENTER